MLPASGQELVVTATPTCEDASSDTSCPRHRELVSCVHRRRASLRRCFSRTASGCKRRYLASLQRRAPHNSRSARPVNDLPHSTHCRRTGATRRPRLCSGCSARHCRVRSAQHARHQEFQPQPQVGSERRERQDLLAARTATPRRWRIRAHPTERHPPLTHRVGVFLAKI